MLSELCSHSNTVAFFWTFFPCWRPKPIYQLITTTFTIKSANNWFPGVTTDSWKTTGRPWLKVIGATVTAKKATKVLMCVKELNRFVNRTSFIKKFVLQLLNLHSHYNEFGSSIIALQVKRQCNGRNSERCEQCDTVTDHEDASKCPQYLFLSLVLPPHAAEQSHRYGSRPTLLNDIQPLATRLRNTSHLKSFRGNAFRCPSAKPWDMTLYNLSISHLSIYLSASYDRSC